MHLKMQRISRIYMRTTFRQLLLILFTEHEYYEFTLILYRLETNASEDATNLTNIHTKHINTITTGYIKRTRMSQDYSFALQMRGITEIKQ